MPTYEYACRSCGHQFEIFQSMKDSPLVDCPSCHTSSLRRLIGLGAGIIFKGSGFYETDYKKVNQKSDTSKESSPSKDPPTAKESSTSSPVSPPASAATSSS